MDVSAPAATPFAAASAVETRPRLRKLVEGREALLVPGAANALTARIVEELGYEAVYLTGAGLANTHLGVPDIGLVTVTELAETAMRISDVCGLPMIVDIDTGFGNQLNICRTVRMLERAGAAALQLEDQVFPKKCGHFDGKRVISLPEMIGKISAALDARTDPNTLIIARTDVRAVEGFASALERGQAFIEAGADATFIEAPESLEELSAIGRLGVPQVANLVVGGRTPMLTQEQLRKLGFGVVLYANVALQAAMRATREVLAHLKDRGDLDAIAPTLATFAERQRIVAKEGFDGLEARFAVD